MDKEECLVVSTLIILQLLMILFIYHLSNHIYVL